MTSFACRRIRAALIDHATGTLARADDVAVREHLAGCATCRADLDAMRELGRALADPMPDDMPEDFWRRQRQSIMRRVRTAEQPATRRAWSFPWQLASALATVVLAVLVSRTILGPTHHLGKHAIERLDDDALVHLHDLLPVIAPATTIEDADSDMLSLHDLGDDDLDSLSEMIGGPS